MNNTTRYRTTQIRPVLQEQGRKQRWLADRIGIHESIVSDWMKGKRTVDAERANEIAKVLGVPFHLLFNEAFVSDVESELEAA